MNILKYYMASIFLISTGAYCGTIGWQNIPSPDYSSSNALLMHSSDQLNNSLNSFSNQVSDIAEQGERNKAQQAELERQDAYYNQLRAQNQAVQEELARRTAYENELKEKKRAEWNRAFSGPNEEELALRTGYLKEKKRAEDAHAWRESFKAPKNLKQ